jgi:drug/metabolite transporter (DMT)-like permease
MIRALVALLLPIVLPILGWVLWARWYRSRRVKAGLDPNVAPDVPVVWLALVAGILLLLTVGLLYFYAEDQGSPPGTPYVPAPDPSVNLNAWPVGAEKAVPPAGGADGPKP